MQIYDPENNPGAEREAFTLLKNPLPEPPRRSHVRMEFDLICGEEDEFDLEIGEEDDFDI
jgi:hypothetical protein